MSVETPDYPLLCRQTQARMDLADLLAQMHDTKVELARLRRPSRRS